MAIFSRSSLVFHHPFLFLGLCRRFCSIHVQKSLISCRIREADGLVMGCCRSLIGQKCSRWSLEMLMSSLVGRVELKSVARSIGLDSLNEFEVFESSSNLVASHRSTTSNPPPAPLKSHPLLSHLPISFQTTLLLSSPSPFFLSF